MSGARLAAWPAAAAQPARSGRRRLAELLVLSGFLLIAVGLTAMTWVDPAVRVPANSAHFNADIYLNIWFMRYAAVAVAHGHLPALLTTAVNAPVGIDVMWNTSMLLPGVILAPVTLLAGPVVSLTVLLTLGFAGSAAAMYLVLRRWGGSIGAAAVGGALYGFSPALMVAAEDHYHLQFAVLPPLIIDAALRLVAGRSRRPVITGAWLGLLVAAQIFIAEELLVDTALAGLIALVVLLVSRPAAVLWIRRLAQIGAGTAAAAAVALLIAGHALWVQFRGPLNETGSPWHIYTSGVQSAAFVTAPSAELLHGSFESYLRASHQQPMEVLAYLGWPLLLAVAVATVVFWRDVRIRVAGLTFYLMEWLGLGSRHFTIAGWSVPLPWHWLLRVPVLSQALPNRFPIIADGAAAAVLAFAIDRARTSLPVRQRWRLPVVAAVVAAVLVPVLPAPVPTASVLAVPAGWPEVLAALHLKPGAPVLVLPSDPYMTGRANAMEWQAISGENMSLIGGYCIVAAPTGRATMCGSVKTITYPQHATLVDTSRLGWGVPKAAGPRRPMLAVAILAWRPAAILVVVGRHRALARYVVSALGAPAIRVGSVLGWRIAQLRPLLTRFSNCALIAKYPWSPCTPPGHIVKSRLVGAVTPVTAPGRQTAKHPR